MRAAWLVLVLVLCLWSAAAPDATTFRGPEISPLPCTEMPALTGAVQTTVGTCATSGTTSTPTYQVFTSGSSATYTTPAGAAQLQVVACAGGGGGGGAGSSTAPTGTTGTTTTFNSINATGGTGGAGAIGTGGTTGGAGGTGGTGSANNRIAGLAGFNGVGGIAANGGNGGGAYYSGYGMGGIGAPSLTTSRSAGAGGGGGECFILNIANPSATYTYTVGGGGAGGVGTGTSAQTGQAGKTGIIVVTELYGVVGGASPSLAFISTQTASAAASMQWTGLGSTYNTYQLSCNRVFPATNTTTIYIQVGEGGGPTWETSSYQWSVMYMTSNTNTVNGFSNSSDSGVQLVVGSNTLAASSAFEATIFNVPVSGVNKMVTAIPVYADATPNVNFLFLSGGYLGDTNTVTAIRVIASTGNISGTCTLYGVLQ